MRAVLIKDGQGPIENLYIGQTDKPVPTKGQVLVKVSAFSSSYGSTEIDLLRHETFVVDCRFRS
jgi:NADPH:quinone reductase-like Zn-dependent oxidoreductase